MPRGLPLDETAQVTLDGSGAGTARLGPSAPGHVWRPTLASVKVATNTDEATCLVYAGPSATDAYFTDGTFSGSSGDATDRVTGKVLNPGRGWIWAVWSGGDAGATATLIVSGTKDIPG